MGGEIYESKYRQVKKEPISSSEFIAKELGHSFVKKVGTLQLSQGTVNVIPGYNEFVLELRDL